MRKIIILGMVVALGLLMASCSGLKSMVVKDVEVQLSNVNQSAPMTYKDLNRSVTLNINSNAVQQPAVDKSNVKDFMNIISPNYIFVPPISSYVRSATETYMSKMGFNLSSTADYTINIKVSKFNIVLSSVNSGDAVISFTYNLVDETGSSIMPTQTVTYKTQVSVNDNLGMDMSLAYWTALGQVDWDRIASYLKVAKTAKQEKNAQVRGAGDTALEHTVIRWNILSSPQGADVSWRVISSTPDVSNTNSNYVGNTPYESTESFDIRGLTYNNSGNVQIEVTCEKNGYLPQKKRFNLRQAIDQKEISAKFNLVKDD